MSLLPIATAVGAFGLMSLAGAREFASVGFGILTATLFVLAPVLWHLFESAPASLTPLLFVTGWLAAMARAEHAPAPLWLIIAGALLGLGVYTSHAATVMMPVYVFLTIALALHARAIPMRQLGLFVSAFTLVAGPLAIGFIVHPERFREIVNAYHLYDADRFNLRQGVREMASWVGLTARSSIYYDFFNPVFLFLSGEVLLLPLIVLVPAGLYRALAVETTQMARLSAAGFVVAPFAASLTAQAPTPSRILFITPFAALLAAYGVRGLAGVWQQWTDSGSSNPLQRSSSPGRSSSGKS